MNVELTPDQRALIKRAIESGRFSREDEAVQEALALWEERERQRLELVAAIDEAEASLARGEGRWITEESGWLMKSNSAAEADSRRSALLAADGRPRRTRGSIRPGSHLVFRRNTKPQHRYR